MRYLISIAIIIIPFLAFAQPPNDDCATATPINIGDCNIYNNVNAAADVGFVNFNPIGLTCTPTANEVWFTFTTPLVITDDLQITITGMPDGATPALSQPNVAVLIGDCASMFMEATACQEAAAGSNQVQFVIPSNNLIPNFPHYIVVSGWSATGTLNEGAFELCVEDYIPPPDICTASASGTTISDCVGTMFDSGGAGGNYGPNENCSVTITPSVFNQCIVATVNFYDTENFGDFLNFYDGPSNASPLIQSLTGVGANLLIQASSGSLTIEFISDGAIESGGFEVTWSCTTDPCTILTPVEVTSLVTVNDLVDALSSPQVLVENPILNCPDGAYGTYESIGTTQLGVMDLPSGIILSTGLAEEVENDEAFFASNINGAPGDADLDALSTGLTTNDACILEFDVYAATDELLFEYVFGSEEYPVYVNSNFNDIFAFFISGPSPTGPAYVNNNIAVLDDGVTPVEINTVNDVNPGAQFQPVSNDVIYNNNTGGLSLPYGGYTSVLTARADVVPCNYYHLKLAIADRGDSSFDSGVFIADLQAGLPELSLQFEINSSSGDNILVEGCSNNDFITAVLTNPDPLDTITYYLHVEGQADENTDLVSPIPDSLIAPPGETIIQIPVIPTNDGLVEGVETFGLQVFGVFQCDTVVYDSVTVIIYDDINVAADQDTFFVCTGTDVQLGVSGATDYTWGWPNPSELDNPNLSDPVLTPSTSGYIYVDGIINGNSSCIGTDSAYIQILDPSISVVTPAPFICENESVVIEVSTNTNGTGISWDPVVGLSCANCPNPTATPSATTTYTATVTAGGCSEQASITVTVDPLAVPAVIATAQICEGSSIVLAGPPTGDGVGMTTYEWIPNDGSIDNLTSPTPTATPPVTTTYTVISTSANGACVDSTSVTINVDPATVDIAGPDTLYQCNDALSTVTLSATSISPASDISWSDSEGNTYMNGAGITANPATNTTYYATVTVGACTNSDSVFVQIDSLPMFNLDVAVPSQSILLNNPDTVDVCSDPSESFFVTNLYNSSLYPELAHEWTVNNMAYNPAQTGANLLDNLPLATSTYILTSTNNACSIQDSFVIDVNTPPNFTISTSSDTICLGENVQLNATGASSFMWDSNDGSLSDNTISNPIATPTQTTTYTAFADIAGCQAGLSTTITVLGVPTINLAPNIAICASEIVNLGLDADVPGWTYTWTPNNFVSGDGTANPTAAPLTTTTYTVVVSNGFCDYTESVTVSVGNNLGLTVSGDTNVCVGETTTLNANTQGAVNWFDSSGTLISSGPNLQVTPSAVGSVNYTIEAFSNLCSTTGTVTVTASATPIVTVSTDENICDGESVNISASTDIGTLSWIPSNEFADPSLGTQTVSPSGTTTYIATADNNGCESNASVTVNVDASPIYGVLDDMTICIGEYIAIGLLDDVGTSYSWVANPADASLTDATEAMPFVSPAETTTYTLTATNGLCTETDMVTISVINPSVSILEIDTVCRGANAMLVAEGDPAGGVYTWYDWEGNAVSNNDTLFVTPWESTSYAVGYVTGGCNAAALGEIYVAAPPAISLTTDAPTIASGESSTLTLSGANIGSTYEWIDLLNDETLTETSNVVIVSPEQTTVYQVNVTSPEGCVYTRFIEIVVLIAEFEVPNIFTPNGDGMNDQFYPVDVFSLDILEFKIFDRWGELVHDNISQGWDGKFSGQDLPSDIYVYFIRVRYDDGTEELKKGDVALMR